MSHRIKFIMPVCHITALNLNLKNNIRDISLFIKSISVILLVMMVQASPLLAQQESLITSWEGTPVIDGELGRGEWQLSGPLTFIQMEPFHGEPATEAVYAGVQHDAEAIYLAFVCMDKYPGGIVANIAARDRISLADDFFLIQIDTYHDRRTAYGFMVNPIGTQTDVAVSDDGKVTDVDWDSEWEAKTSINDSSWILEVSIPFKSMRYNRKLETWGINFARMHRRTSELSTWAGPVNHYYQVSTEGAVTGLELSGTRNSFYVLPYGTLRYEDSDISGNHGRWIPDGGVDARWQFTKSSVANATVNPDFATVEGDREQVNLTRYELFYPEKRQFFLEANDMYLTGIRTFYSRRIGDIYGGIKAAGKEGKYAYSAIGVYSVRDTADDVPPSFYTIARVKRDVLRSSSVGLTFTDKSHVRGFARTFSGDYLLNLGKDWKLSGQVVGSAPGDLYGHSAWFVNFARESNIYHAHLTYSYTGKDFMETVNQTGFIRDDDRQEFDGDLRYTFWMQKGIFKYIFLASYNNVFWNHDYKDLRSWYFAQRAKFYLRNRLSFDLSYNNDFKLYEKKYYNHRYEIEVGYNTDEWSSVEVGYYWGRNFDRDFTLITGEGRVRLWKKLSVGYELNILDYRPDTTNSSTWINIASLDYYFTRDLWVRIFAQNNTNIEKVYMYGLFGWRFRPPFSAVYLIYTSDHFLPPGMESRVKSDVFFLKVSYQIGK